MQTTIEPKQLLEQFIDGSSLFAVLEMIEVICQEKAEHISANWQDQASACAWRRAAGRINAAVNSNEVLSVS